MRSGNTLKHSGLQKAAHMGTTWRALSKEIGDLIKQSSIVGKPVASSRTEAVSCGLRRRINRRSTSSLMGMALSSQSKTRSYCFAKAVLKKHAVAPAAHHPIGRCRGD